MSVSAEGTKAADDGFDLTVDNAATYLRERNLLAAHAQVAQAQPCVQTAQADPDTRVAHVGASAGQRARVTELGGGISNTVLLVQNQSTVLVVKQSLAKLRVADDWEFDRRRLLVEAKCMEVLGRILDPGEVPSMLDLDRENLIFTMTAAPAGGVVWKQALLDGNVDLTAARRAGDLLGRIHRHAADDPSLAEAFDDLMPLIEGRIEPYHRVAASVHPDLETHIERDIARLTTQRRTLVLGDYSPKNLIVYPDRVLALDFEAAHWGDPSFDTGFMITHLVAKAIHIPEKQSEFLAAARQFFTAYSDAAGTAGATPADTTSELGVLLLCRVDGKSKLEYLDAAARDAVRRLARELIARQVTDLDEALALAAASQPDPSRR